MSDLAAMEARARAATRGPWQAYTDDGLCLVVAPDGDAVCSVWGNLGMDDGYGDVEVCDFIAHARTDVPALIAEVRRLQREVAAGRHAQATIKALQQTIDHMSSGKAGSTETVYALPRPSTLILPTGASIEDACNLLGEDQSNWKAEGVTGQAVTYTRIDAEKNAGPSWEK